MSHDSDCCANENESKLHSLKIRETLSLMSRNCHATGKRGSRVVSALASCARGPGFEPRRRRGKFVGPNLLPFVSFAGMT